MPRIYQIDSNNRLIILKNNESISPEGLFKIDSQNRLIFSLNEPENWRKVHDFPDQLTFVGNWKLNANYDLELKLEQTESLSGEGTLVLQGNIISLEGERIVFGIKSVDKNGLSHLRILNLSGSLNLDASNQIFFSVTKKTSPDTLAFGAGWRVNKNQQITYTYQKTNLITKSKSRSAIDILGFWQITAGQQLAYALSTGTDCRFDFQAAIQTPNIYPKEGVIKYRLGAGVREGSRAGTKVISLFGAWKLNRSLGLSFEMEYLKSEFHSLEFAAEISLDKNNRVVFSLKGVKVGNLGVSVIFTHRLIKNLDAEVFLRLKHSLKESGVDVGVLFPF